MLSHFSHVRLFVTLWTIAHQGPLSTGFWSELLCLPLGDLLDQEIEPAALVSPALTGRFLPILPPGKPRCKVRLFIWDLSCFLREDCIAINFHLRTVFACPIGFAVLAYMCTYTCASICVDTSTCICMCVPMYPDVSAHVSTCIHACVYPCT